MSIGAHKTGAMKNYCGQACRYLRFLQVGLGSSDLSPRSFASLGDCSRLSCGSILLSMGLSCSSSNLPCRLSGNHARGSFAGKALARPNLSCQSFHTPQYHDDCIAADAWMALETSSQPAWIYCLLIPCSCHQ